uniref:Uncharacterized protein n=1 Tax=Leersia perrieri TaxID=77586 RepID=A0A0D9Y156_9ORYZ
MSMALVLAVVLAAAVDAGAGAGGGRTALDGVCSDLGGYYVTPELCKSALCGGDTSSRPRKRRGAAAGRAVAASVESVLQQHSPNTSSSIGNYSSAPAAAEGIRSCVELYGGAVAALEWAARSVAAGRYRGAREVLQAAQYVSLGCEGMAGGHGGAVAGEAPLPRENERFGSMAMVAHAVVASMVGPD